MFSQNPQKMKQNKTWVSWNENLKHSYQNLHTVTTEKQLAEVITKAKKVRFFGSKQSSSDIAAGVDTLIDINSYNKIVSYNNEELLVTAEAGMKLGDLIEAIEAKGWCIPCLPDINTVTLGGALATGTHGTSGQPLCEYMTSCRLILADGTIKEINNGDPLMDALRVSLGVLGVMSTITFKCEPIYTLHLKEGPEKDEKWLSTIKEDLKKHDFLRILWLPHTDHGYVIKGDKIDPNTPINDLKAPEHVKNRRKASKILYKYTHIFPWFTAIANKILFKRFFKHKTEHKGSLYQATVTKKRGSTLELAEWTVALDKFPALLKELKEAINSWKNDAFIHIPMDVRFIYSDQSWLSYGYQQDTVTMGCVCRNTASADTYEAFNVVEEIFLKYGGRPHWGKRFKAKDAELAKLYPKWKDFKELRGKMDPTNKFLNPYLTEVFTAKA